MFFGGSSTDWVNLGKVAIPQADEQQRLLGNLIQVMNRDRKPLPRFWYFPRSLKAVVVGTGDDHGNGGTAGRFDQYLANSPAGCSVADWTCPRFGSYVYPGTPLSDSSAAAYTNQGFEVGIHPSTNCGNYTAVLDRDDVQHPAGAVAVQLPEPVRAGHEPAALHRLERLVVPGQRRARQRDAAGHELLLLAGILGAEPARLHDRLGHADAVRRPDGTMLDIYQAATQMTDESDQTYPFTPNTLLDNALGPLGYYGAFTANMHTDAATIPQNDALIASAQARGVPIVSGKQLLTWIDGRNASSYGDWPGAPTR